MPQKLSTLHTPYRYLLALLFIPMIWAASCKHDPMIEPTICFTNEVLPILQSNCARSGCHDAITKREGLDYSSYESTLNGGSVKAFRPDRSEMIQVIKLMASDAKVMPPLPNRLLTFQEKDILSLWVQEGAVDIPCAVNCDTTQFTYSGAVRPTIDTHCLGCHSGGNPSGNQRLETYEQLKEVALNGTLEGVLYGSSRFALMPPTGQLSSCKIRQIEKWIDAGAVED